MQIVKLLPQEYSTSIADNSLNANFCVPALILGKVWQKTPTKPSTSFAPIWYKFYQ
ncbi:MAG: hypothetical protein KME28_21205 [Pelatocladus maniniholoensis HA4357-MV3]|uniref:Uncharacterized protein n=1 Tax=Pelatocladus maniniholoensis HA4357-MV3 TaxID=1117104 RepID=A0A9E3LVK1_9NOST|nr:hypothetical protein [Pelatocladus maniniholoensis HA4357-MV3]